jgi:5'-methylthioadenosine phosphorylase
MTIGLITGSGLEEFGFDICETMGLETEYGRVVLRRAEAAGRELYLLHRHGSDHDVPPHRVNYRANLRGLREVGCRVVIATNAVGSLRQTMKPGDLALPNQFIDATHNRPTTFFDGDERVVRASSPPQVRHVDVTEPYCNHLRVAMAEVVERHEMTLHPAATYICTEGPRFETPAEIRAYAQWGADVVGMTGVPEVVLARELGICYASLCLVTNFAAGISAGPITSEEIEQIARDRRQALDRLLRDVLLSVEDSPDCPCHQWWQP